MNSKVDASSPSAKFTFDMNTSTLYRKDRQNYINVLGIEQLNTLEQTSLLDIYLSKDEIIEPHYHQNAAQLVYCISGAATVSIYNPFSKQLLHYPLTPGEVANVPHGWWHYEVATANNTHLLAIFNAPTPEVILGSEILTATPSSIIAKTYCVDQKEWEKVTAPIQPGTFIGPPKNCRKQQSSQIQPIQPPNPHFTPPFYYHYYPYYWQ